MAKLVYWIVFPLAEHESTAYAIRAKTRKELLLWREHYYLKHGSWPEYTEPPKKVEIQYKDAFDLMEQCNGEGGCGPESTLRGQLMLARYAEQEGMFSGIEKNAS